MSELTRLLQATAAAHPRRVAVTEQDQVFSYKELWSAAAATASRLQAAGLGGRPVLLGLPPGPRWIIGLLGTWLSGAAAVPVDVTHPAARLSQIATACTAAGVLTANGRPPKWAASLSPVPFR
ncbi:AMP-binding protein [Streptomyces sp. NPDC058284]|uniref:AMP-binding protein n=1 Tax=unclassified Streptomyces TaxID=2593676 RepID=UPI0036551CC7